MLRDLEAAGVVKPGPGPSIEETTRRHIEARARGIPLRQVDELLDDVIEQAMAHIEALRHHVENLRNTFRQSGELAMRAALLSMKERQFLRPRVMREVPQSQLREPDGGSSS
jgi:hypothetical protein